MNRISETLLRRYLKPTVESDLPGRLRLSFSKYKMLPKEAEPYLHYVQDVFKMLPGVKDVQVNARIGTILVHYEAAKMSAHTILRWIDAVTDEGIAISKEVVWEGATEENLEALVRKRLMRRLAIGD